MNGGMQRCIHIMHQLAKHFALTAIVHQNKRSFMECSLDFPELAQAHIQSTNNIEIKDIFSIFKPKWQKALRSRWYQRQWNRPADSSLVKYYPLLTKLLKHQRFDVIILESMTTLNAINIIRRYDKKVQIIYDAHNVDSTLAKAAFERKEITEIELKGNQISESTLHKRVNAIITCSQNDKNIFQQMNGERLSVAVVPNGVNIPTKINNQVVHQDHPDYILFCGSLWSIPNAEGLYWFCKKVWPLVTLQWPTLKLLVVGIGKLPAKFLEIKDTKNIELIGEVEDVNLWYQKSAVSVAPLLTGSGTRLKILEAMGFGVPVISTSIGAQGIEYTINENIVIADEENDFAEKLIDILRNKSKRISISQAAKNLVREKYDWNVIGNKMANFLNGF